MNELIRITARELAGGAVQTVNARELHEFLGLSRDFNQWMREQIERARLVEGRDYLSYEDVGNPSGGRPRKECAVSIDAAKHVAMMSGSDKGFEVRDYFIECERKAQASVSNIYDTLKDPANMRTYLLHYVEKVIALESTVAEQAPKVEALDRIASAEGSLCVRDAAKALQVRPIDLKNWLIVNRWIYGRPGYRGWLAYQDRIQQGVMVHKVSTLQREDGTEKIVEQARITPKGMARIAESLQRKAA